MAEYSADLLCRRKIDTKTFVAVAPDGSVLTKSEWLSLIRDNISKNGKKRTRVSKYTMSDVRIFCSPYSEEAEGFIDAARLRKTPLEVIK